MNGAREMAARCVWPVQAQLGEGPLWMAAQQRLYFVDIKAGLLHALDAGSGERLSWTLPDYSCWIIPRRDGDGFLAGLRRGVVRLWLEPVLRIEPLGLAPALVLAEGVRLNDAKADAHGNVWFGSMHNDELQRPDGRLFCLSPALELSEHASGIHICNGPAFSVDGRLMYHTDSFTGQVSVFGRDNPGPALWRQFDTEAEGSPDGMTVDAEGGVWIAQWGGGRVCRYRPDGQLDLVVRLPVSQPSSCAFGGPAMSTLYITSARQDLGPEQLAREPLAGALFAVELEVQGLPAARFG